MDFRIKRGYIIANSGKPGPLYVAPHAAPAYYKPGDHQDHNTHYISFHLAKNGGMALIASLSREKDIGIDFFRTFPNQKTAVSSFPIFEDGNQQDISRRKRRFAWAAKNITEHAIKMEIYTKFWTIIKNYDGPIVFVHRQFFNPIRHPSLMDVIPYNHHEFFKGMVEKLNEKYKEIFDKMFPVYKSGFEFKMKCVSFKEDMLESQGLNLFHGKHPDVKRREEKFKKKMKEMPELKVTYMKNFRGVPMNMLMKQHKIKSEHPIFQAEISEFITRRFPGIAVKMIEEIMEAFPESS